MGSAFVILSIIGMLFLGMYLYAYGTTKYSAFKEKRKNQKMLRETLEKEEEINRERQERIRLREENSRLAEARSKLIKKEIARLQQLKEKQKI